MTRLLTWAFALTLLAGSAFAGKACCCDPECCVDMSCDMPCCK